MISAIAWVVVIFGIQTVYCQGVYRWVWGRHLRWPYCWAAMPALLLRRRLASWESSWRPGLPA